MNILKKILPYLVAFILFLILSHAYLSPLMEGKVLHQADVTNFKGMSKEIVDFREKYDAEPLWTNSMFGGMPSYLISTLYHANLFKPVFNFIKIGKRPADMIFISMVSFFILLICMGVSPWLAIIGAIAYAFSSYNIIILEAGHNSKADAIALVPLMIAGFILLYQKKWLWGFVLSSLGLTLQLIANHLQITYYAFLVLFILGLFYLYESILKKKMKQLILSTSLFIAAFALAAGINFSQLWVVYEYSHYSMRGESELTIDEENKTKGLDKDYATAWSYSLDETLTLLIPNFKGGASGGSLTTNSATYELFKNAQGAGYARQVIKSLPLYWGTQPFTSGPVYLGAFIVFLFVLGLFTLKGNIKWWLLTASLLSLFLAWGHHVEVQAILFIIGICILIYAGFSYLENKAIKKYALIVAGGLILTGFILPHKIATYPFNHLVLDYFPGYNKFRTVSMTLVIVGFTAPLMGFLVLKKIMTGDYEKPVFLKHLKYTLYIVGGICLFFALLPGAFFNFTSEADQRYIQSGMGALVDALQEDRKTLLQQDALRSLIFVFLGAGTLWFFVQKKIKQSYFLVLIGFIVLIDLWTVDKRYLDNDDFISKRKAEVPFVPTRADKMILEDKDPNFRVLNLSVSTFNDASTSYFHKSIGGYHGAKMKRYQELIDFHISQNNMDVLNMLNTKYIIVPTEDKQPFPRRNPDALGNAWFVDSYRIVENADEEIMALEDFDPAKEAIIDKRWQDQLENFAFQKDSIRKIELTSYKANELVYNYAAETPQMVVFSEIFYNKGWNAYVNDELLPHFRCNYVLRGMVVPEGKHTITFKFEPKSYYAGNKVSLASSILLILIVLGVIALETKKHFSKK